MRNAFPSSTDIWIVPVLIVPNNNKQCGIFSFKGNMQLKWLSSLLSSKHEVGKQHGVPQHVKW